MRNITSEHAELLTRISPDAPRSGALALDPSNAEHRTLIVDVLQASGKDPDRYPALHAAIESGVATAAGDADDGTIIDLGRDSQGRATARGWVASRGKAFISGATTIVQDGESGEILASGAATQVGGTLAQAATVSEQARGAADRMIATTIFHAQQTPDSPPRFGLVAATADTEDQPIPITVNDPQPIKQHQANTLIGLCRDNAHMGDVDYAYIEPPGSNPDPDRLVVPFTGSADLSSQVDLTRPIQVATKLYVAAAKAWLQPLSSFPLTGQAANGNTVKWSYPFDGQVITQTASIQYEATAQANNNNPSAFFFQFTVPIQGLGSQTVTFTVCSVDTPDEPSINCQQIPDLQFWWHCVGADTKILLADGASEAPIAEVDMSMSVRAGLGEATPAVAATTRAFHDDNGGLERCRRLVTEGGASLLLSGRHPVITPNGPVAAEDLGSGDRVLTANGSEAVASCAPEEYDGIVYDLAVPRDDGEIGTFVANGIVVGDHYSLDAYDRKTRHDPEYMLPRLPESQHQDFLSAVADQAR